MSLRDWAPGRTISEPRGMWASLRHRRGGTPDRAFEMQNMRIQFGTVRTRPGTSGIFPTKGRVGGMFNWLLPNTVNAVLYQDGTQIQSYRQDFGQSTFVVDVPPTTLTPSIAPFDVWAYICGYDTLGSGTMQVQITDGINTDKAFRGPPSLTAASAVDGGTGNCTAGTHFIGFVYQNRTGAEGQPVTTIGGNPISVTLDAGLRQINISVTLPAQPDGGFSGNGGVQATLFLIATRADNTAQFYFIPDDDQVRQIGSQSVPLNQAVTLHFVMNFSDETIASSLAGDLATDNFQFLSQDTNGAGPFNPAFVVAYGNRMCYGVGTSLYVSDIGFPQHLAADRNQVRDKNQRAIKAAFQLPGNTNIYVTGDRFTAYATDNGDFPSTWPPPIGVSDALGAPFPNCVCASTSGSWAWIVTEAGPYLFDGAYGVMPVTYLASGYDEQKKPIGWNRVNWAAAYNIQIKDDVLNMRLYIAVPMDGAIEPNYLFCIDYREGKTFETVDISLDKFAWGSFSSIAVIKEWSNGISNLWLSPTGLKTTARLDLSLENDLSLAIDGLWTSGFGRGKNIAAAMVRVGGIMVWARGEAPLDAHGNPTFLITFAGPDGVDLVTVILEKTKGVPSALTEEPGIYYMGTFDISQIEDWTVTFRTNTKNAWFELSSFTVFEKSDLANR